MSDREKRDNSLHLLSPSKGVRHIIIYVHGFTGGITTFKNNSGRFFHEFLDSRITSACDFASFNYGSRLLELRALRRILLIFSSRLRFQLSPNHQLDRYSALLQTYCDSLRNKYETINFLCHSMGGVIVRQLFSHEMQKSRSAPGFLITLATPHQGVAEANALRVLGNTHITELEPFSERISSLNSEWPKISNRIKGRFYSALDDGVVHYRSAFPPGEEHRTSTVEGTHTSIAKPDTSNCALIRSLNLVIPSLLGLPCSAISSLSLSDLILFEGYRSECKPFYLLRDQDAKLQALLKHSHVWITGPTGCGKTVLIQHSAVESNNPFVYVDLSPCCGKASSESYLKVIYESVANQLQGANIPCQGDIIPAISNSLAACGYAQVTILIDEWHLGRGDVFNTFSAHLMSLATFHSNRMEKQGIVRFVISSGSLPEFGSSFEAKYHAMFTVMELGYWTDCDIRELIKLTLSSLEVRCPNDAAEKIAIAANGSPRRAKSLIRKFVTLGSFEPSDILSVVERVKEEEIK